MYLKKVISKKTSKKTNLLLASDEKYRIRIRIQICNPVYRSKGPDPDLSQNVTDPEN
jgi:hypothetical protein